MFFFFFFFFFFGLILPSFWFFSYSHPLNKHVGLLVLNGVDLLSSTSLKSRLSARSALDASATSTGESVVQSRLLSKFPPSRASTPSSSLLFSTRYRSCPRSSTPTSACSWVPVYSPERSGS